MTAAAPDAPAQGAPPARDGRPLTLLVFSSLYPNPVEPHHGIFVANRLQRWLERHGGRAEVVAPVPLAPPVGPERWRRYRQVPAVSEHRGLTVHHPRYLSPPGFGDRWRGALMAASVRRCLTRVAARLQPDLFDVHYAYPDGVAGERLRDGLARTLGRPLPMVLTCRGTDLNLLPSIPTVRRQIAATLGRCDHVVTVAEALRQVALELGAAPERVTTLRNGVDIERFSPGDRAAARRQLGLPEQGPLLLCVGHLIRRKGQHLLLEAYARRFGADGPPLLLVGGGDDRQALEEQVRGLGLERAVTFVGPVTPEVLVQYYRAASTMILASLREGWPNVVLEALACGTPVLATRIWGTPEILSDCPAGRLVEASVDGLHEGLADLDDLDPDAARPWAEAHTWEATVDGMQDLFTRLVGAART